MKSWQKALPTFLPAQYCVTNESHSQSFESWLMSLSKFTSRLADLGRAGDLAPAVRGDDAGGFPNCAVFGRHGFSFR